MKELEKRSSQNKGNSIWELQGNKKVETTEVKVKKNNIFGHFKCEIYVQNCW